MALADYRLCDHCEHKAFYDGDDSARAMEDEHPDRRLLVVHRRCLPDMAGMLPHDPACSLVRALPEPEAECDCTTMHVLEKLQEYSAPGEDY